MCDVEDPNIVSSWNPLQMNIASAPSHHSDLEVFPYLTDVSQHSQERQRHPDFFRKFFADELCDCFIVLVEIGGLSVPHRSLE